MKKIVSLLLVICLALGLSSAFAAGGPKITQQPEFGDSKSETTVVIEIKAKSYKGLTWRFVNPETSEEVTAKELSKLFKGIKVKNPNKQKITLEKVPEEMDGWQVYCHLTGNGYQVDSDRLTISLDGTSEPASAPAEVPAAEEPDSEPDAEFIPDAAPSEIEEETPADSDSEPYADEEEEEESSESGAFTVTGENVTLYPLDSFGNPDEDGGAASLSFTDFGGVEARADEDVDYWIINGIRITPNENVTSVKLQNITSDMIISAVTTNTADEADLNDGDRVQVVCVGCRFTYMADNLVSVTSGSVPRGADIIVMTDSKAAAGGYSINGGEYVREGKISFRLTVSEDTEIRTK